VEAFACVHILEFDDATFAARYRIDGMDAEPATKTNQDTIS
jgi:hypothetical protein